MMLKPVYETLNNDYMSGTVDSQIDKMIDQSQNQYTLPAESDEDKVNKAKLRLMMEDLKFGQNLG